MIKICEEEQFLPQSFRLVREGGREGGTKSSSNFGSLGGRVSPPQAPRGLAAQPSSKYKAASRSSGESGSEGAVVADLPTVAVSQKSHGKILDFSRRCLASFRRARSSRRSLRPPVLADGEKRHKMLERHCRIGATYTKQPCLQPLRLRFPCTTD